MVNEFKLTVVHAAHPNPMQVTAEQKTLENQDRAAGPSGIRAAGPWRAAGLLLAKPL